MNEPSADFDLKLMPDWLKEAPAKNPYANYEVRESDRLPFGEKRGRGGDSQRPRGRGQGGGLGGGLGRGGDGPRVKRDEGKRDQIRGEQRPGFRSGPRENREGPRPHHAPSQPPPVRVEFLPDPACVSSIAKQIRATNRAYSLFDLARMFLAKPERHRVRITTNDKNAPLFQAGENGPVSLERGSLERAAFRLCARSFTRRRRSSANRQGEFFKRRALPIDRHVARPDESSRLSARAAEALRGALQPAHAVPGFSARNPNRERPSRRRSVERGGARERDFLSDAR